MIWVNAALTTNNWKILDIPDTNNVVAIELNGTYGKLQIFSIYNVGKHSELLTVMIPQGS